MLLNKVFNIAVVVDWELIIWFTLLLIIPYVLALFMLLYFCILLHELAHAITAINNGLKVRRIRLSPLGGFTIINKNLEDINPEIALKIFMAGPIMSLFLGGIFGITTIFLQPGMLLKTVQVMFLVNIFLGLFNLLPILSLDGGYALRSFLQRKRSFFDATMLTVKTSKYMMGGILIATFIFAIIYNSISLLQRAFIVVINILVIIYLYVTIKEEIKNIKSKKKQSKRSKKA